MITTDATVIAPWLETRAGVKLHPETQYIAHQISGKIATAVGFSNYRPDSDIELTVATEGKGLKSAMELIRAVFAYVFDQSNCRRCTVRISERNEKSIKLATRLGFKVEGRLRQGFGDADALVFGLLRDDFYGLCRQPPESP